MKYLLAFDKFKGSLSASEACAIAQEAILELDPHATIHQRPLTDGGEGFCEITTQALGGVFRDYRVTYPDLRSGDAKIGYVFLNTIPDKVRSILDLPASGLLAIIEMAQAAGHQLVSNIERNPWNYSSIGVGEMIRYAHAEGCSSFLIGMGGSATNDMGIGLLESFGLIGFNDQQEKMTSLIPAKWNQIERFEAPLNLPKLSIRIACDVNNPLHGENGSAAIYGPQKGLKPDDLATMQDSMKRIDHLIRPSFDANNVNSKSPGMGAAGGLPFSLTLAFDTKLVPGFELINEILELDHKTQDADIILTGEGALDKSSLSGKGPYQIIEQGILKEKQVCVYAGKVFDDARNQLAAKCEKVQINQVGDKEANIEENIANERHNLKRRIIETLPVKMEQ